MSILRLILIALLLTACTQETPPTTQPPLKIGINLWAGYAHVFLAEKKGFFNPKTVKLVFKPEITEIIQLYKSGELDGMFNVLSDIIMLNAEGLPTQVVYIADYSDQGDAIFGFPELENLSNLKGKTVAFEGINTFSHLLVVKLLEQAGVQEGEFQGVNLLASKVLEALETKKIDAGHIYGPTQALAIEKGYKMLGKAGDMPGIITDVLAFKTEVVEKRSEEIQKVVKSLLEVREFLYAHPDEALPMMAKALNMSKAEMKIGIQGSYHPNLAEHITALQMGGNLFNVGQQIMDFYLEKGQLPQLVDLNQVINGQFVQALSEE
jgi:NitT/TauT family transport system substrate-binding protein